MIKLAECHVIILIIKMIMITIIFNYNNNNLYLFGKDMHLVYSSNRGPAIHK